MAVSSFIKTIEDWLQSLNVYQLLVGQVVLQLVVNQQIVVSPQRRSRLFMKNVVESRESDSISLKSTI